MNGCIVVSMLTRNTRLSVYEKSTYLMRSSVHHITESLLEWYLWKLFILRSFAKVGFLENVVGYIANSGKANWSIWYPGMYKGIVEVRLSDIGHCSIRNSGMIRPCIFYGNQTVTQNYEIYAFRHSCLIN